MHSVFFSVLFFFFFLVFLSNSSSLFEIDSLLDDPLSSCHCLLQSLTYIHTYISISNSHLPTQQSFTKAGQLAPHSPFDPSFFPRGMTLGRVRRAAFHGLNLSSTHLCNCFSNGYATDCCRASLAICLSYTAPHCSPASLSTAWAAVKIYPPARHPRMYPLLLLCAFLSSSHRQSVIRRSNENESGVYRK